MHPQPWDVTSHFYWPVFQWLINFTSSQWKRQAPIYLEGQSILRVPLVTGVTQHKTHSSLKTCSASTQRPVSGRTMLPGFHCFLQYMFSVASSYFSPKPATCYPVMNSSRSHPWEFLSDHISPQWTESKLRHAWIPLWVDLDAGLWKSLVNKCKSS